MTTRVKVASQVQQFVKALAPEPRCRLTLAIKALAQDRGDLKPLEGRLEGYSRLRIAGYRVIFAQRAERGQRIVDCVFAENRAVGYELCLKLLSEGLGD